MAIYRLKVYPRRLVPLYYRDLLGTDALFRMNQKKLKNMYKSIKKAYDRIKETNEFLANRLRGILRSLRIRYIVNHIVELPERGPRIVYQRQTFRNFINDFCCMDYRYLSVPLSARVRFRSEEDLHRFYEIFWFVENVN